jgi:hypothetical protein
MTVTDRIRATQPDEGLRRAQHADTTARIRGILLNAAARIDRKPDALMTDLARFVTVQLAVWEHYGIYNVAPVGRDIIAARTAIKDVPLVGTRSEYAARLRLHLGAVSL